MKNVLVRFTTGELQASGATVVEALNKLDSSKQGTLIGVFLVDKKEDETYTIIEEVKMKYLVGYI